MGNLITDGFNLAVNAETPESATKFILKVRDLLEKQTDKALKLIDEDSIRNLTRIAVLDSDKTTCHEAQGSLSFLTIELANEEYQDKHNHKICAIINELDTILDEINNTKCNGHYKDYMNKEIQTFISWELLNIAINHPFALGDTLRVVKKVDPKFPTEKKIQGLYGKKYEVSEITLSDINNKLESSPDPVTT